MTHHTGNDEGLFAALDEAMRKRLADWRASTSETYFPLGSEDGPKVLVNYLLFGPGSVTEVLAARAAAPDALRAQMLAWDEGWWKGQNDDDPTVMGYALNPYRERLAALADPVSGNADPQA